MIVTCAKCGRNLDSYHTIYIPAIRGWYCLHCAGKKEEK